LCFLLGPTRVCITRITGQLDRIYCPLIKLVTTPSSSNVVSRDSLNFNSNFDFELELELRESLEAALEDDGEEKT
jgi:hypothetical protein